MVHKMYKQHARPSARVVYGLQASWDPVVAAAYDEDFSGKAAWSPCGRFIAVAKSRAVEIRDAITLNLLSNFESPPDAWALSFSPDARFLTQFHCGTMVTWDLQTGVSVITASPEQPRLEGWDSSPAYSMDGKMLVGEYFDVDSKETFITTHDFSTTRTHSYRVSEGHMISLILTHGEFLQFATVKSGYITIWQVDFTFTYPPEVVESLPTPDEVTEAEAFAQYVFLPTISRLAITLKDTLLIWDARDSKRLLKISSPYPFWMSFSSDGRLFACVLQRRGNKGIHIWKETPAGYTLLHKLTYDSLRDCPKPLLSPNGESIILTTNSMTRLLHTEDPLLSSRPTPAMAQLAFILNFSPDNALAAFTGYPKTKNVVTILDLQSGNPQLEIDTGMKVKCLGVAGSAIVATDREKVVTWNLDTRNARTNIHDSTRITTFDLSPYPLGNSLLPVSVSSDLSRIITLSSGSTSTLLAIHDVPTGRCLVGPTSAKGALKPLSTFKATDINGHVGVETAWLSPDGREVWGASDSNSPMGGWEVIEVEDDEPSNRRLQPLEMTKCQPGALPWQSSHGYEVTNDGWVLSPTQKRLLWLPHPWRSVARHRTWSGRFLGLFHLGLPEVVILEFLD